MSREQRSIGSGFGAATTADEVLAGVDGADRTALVTGGYSGLGLETTRALIRAGVRVLVPARRPGLARARLADLGAIEVVPLDLADLARVRRSARELRESLAGLDIVISAAGVMATPERRVGPGWESQFAINHLGHLTLVQELWPLLVAGAGARVVAYSSAGHHLSDIRWDDLQFARGYDKWLAYGQSKTANVLFARWLGELGAASGIRAFSLHPGAIITELQRELSAAEQIELGWIDRNGAVVGEGFKSPAQGAATGVWAATSPALTGLGGLYLEDCEVAGVAGPDSSMADGGVREYAIDPGAAERLWWESERLTGEAPTFLA